VTSNPFNAELGLRVLATIETDRTRWDQTRWVTRNECGTAYCFAGLTCELTGHDLSQATGAVLSGLGTDHVESIPATAGRELGLTGRAEYAATVLFQGSNTLDELRDIVTGYAEAATMAELITVAEDYDIERDDE